MATVGGSGSCSMLANRNAKGHEVNASTREGDRRAGASSTGCHRTEGVRESWAMSDDDPVRRPCRIVSDGTGRRVVVAGASAQVDRSRFEPWSVLALVTAVLGLVPLTWPVPILSLLAVAFALVGLRESQSTAPSRTVGWR